MYDAEEVSEVKITSDNFESKNYLQVTNGFGVSQWNLKTKNELQLDFVNGKFPKIYGIALDGQRGVAVDNFAMRGSSAIGFDKINKAMYTQAMKAMNVRAVILQYGINVVPNIKSDYSYYKKALIKQLKTIQAANPGVTIIVIGPSDMSQNKNGQMISYSNIPLIRDAMKAAAMSTGCCFWDLYEAMGGKNSMSGWVNKGLAQKDYTHFTYKGASYVGEMLFDAIIEQVYQE
jgi:lysophospholipase L1-like esterase